MNSTSTLNSPRVVQPVLRIRASLAQLAAVGQPLHCQWALLQADGEVQKGECLISEVLRAVPTFAARTQVMIPAPEVLITRRQLPASARRHQGSVLAYAVEDVCLSDPELNQVSWLAAPAAGMDVLAVVDKSALTRWSAALTTAGVRGYELHCETLLLPRSADQWSLAWDGREGFVRTGDAEGFATDCGDADTPPLALYLQLEQARASQELPAAIAVYLTSTDVHTSAQLNIKKWSQLLGVPLHFGGTWHWQAVGTQNASGPTLARQRQHWQWLRGVAARLRPVVWLLAAALAVHTLALLGDWARLTTEQRALRGQMEAQFRAAFPEAVAVVDPVLQMRRQLTTARQMAGQSDAGDFPPMLEALALAANELPLGMLKALAYGSGRLTLEFANADAASIARVVSRLREGGLLVDSAPQDAAAFNTAIDTGTDTLTLVVRVP